MIKKILIVVILLIAGFLTYVALQPSHYIVSREATISASPAKIFPFINNSKKMNEWNPWAEFDPKATMTFTGPDSGVGTKTSWDGGDKLGTGSATVVESVENSLVKTKLEYQKPYVMTQEAQITLTPVGDQTLVKWSVEGHNNFMGRMMCVFMNMDKMVGGIFEQGLAKLKTKVEPPKSEPSR